MMHLQLLHDLITEDVELRRITIIAKEYELSTLAFMGWIDCWVGQEETDYKLTEKGLTLMQEIEELFVKPKKQKVVIDIPDAIVTAYNLIFPKVKIPTSGKYARTNEGQLKKSFQWFLAEYPQYSWETILQATQRYVGQKEQENWNYMRTSGYFIRKQDANKVWTSDLADFCMQVVEGIEDDTQQHFVEKIV
jgi:hypothetical protein